MFYFDYRGSYPRFDHLLNEMLTISRNQAFENQFNLIKSCHKI